jgi:hypothetical protein
MTVQRRYSDDVLTPGWQRAGRPVSAELVLERGQVLEDPTSGFCGAVLFWENGLVVLEDRHGKRRSFPLGGGLTHEGEPVIIRTRTVAPVTPKRTASGSVRGSERRARTALASRIFVEGRHDAELVEKVWGEDLRHVGVVVEYLGGIDDLPQIVTDFGPERGRRLGVLVDHLVPGSKESHIAAEVGQGSGGDFVRVLGHPFLDIWQAVRPELLGLSAWPQIPRDQDLKYGTCRVLGWPARDQADIAAAWRNILGRVRSWHDLERPLLNTIEQLIDFVTQDHPADPG